MDDETGSEGLPTIKCCFYNIILFFLFLFFIFFPVIMQSVLNTIVSRVCMEYYMLSTY